MHPLQRTLLRAKHWELCCLWIFLRISASFAATTIKNHSLVDPLSSPLYFLLSIVRMLDVALIFAWSWGAGTFLNSISPQHLRLNRTVFFFASAGFFVLVLLPDQREAHMLWLALPHVAMGFISLGYMLRFPAKTLLVAEFQEPARFTEYFGCLLGVIFFPIGIWFLQPRVNELFALWHVLPPASNSAPSLPGLST